MYDRYSYSQQGPVMHQNSRASNASKMRSEKSSKCFDKSWLKTFLLFFNFLIVLTGIGLLALGIYFIFSREAFASVMAGQVFYISHYLIILSGFLILVTSTLGFVGIWRSSPGMLTGYIVLLAFILFIEVGSGILSYAFSELMRGYLVQRLTSAMQKEYGYADSQVVTRAVDHLQIKFRCCGAESYRDWAASSYAGQENATRGADASRVPESCCKTRMSGCGRLTHPSNINTLGCVAYLFDYMRRNLHFIMIAASSIAVIELLGLIIACCLRNVITPRIKKRAY